MYSPKEIFSNKTPPNPRVMVAPQRYIQGAGVIEHIGRYISLLKVKRVAVLASKRGLGAEGVRVSRSLIAHNIDVVNAEFGGECSRAEIQKHASDLADERLDCLIALGGGKPVDAGKSIAYRLDVPVVVIPTLASNDAPCSALSVLYTPDGVSDTVEFFPANPAMVVVDTDVVTDADERYLVAGMGDAMATWYEARVCFNNPTAITPLGARPTLASCAMGETCAHTLYAYGEAAAQAVASNNNDDAVEKVVEANTLLSGIGFESGGLAVAHSMALAFTQIDQLHENYLHGELVAMGTMTQLALEDALDPSIGDARKAAEFFARVGLPVNLHQLSLAPNASRELDIIVEATLANPYAHHMPMQLTHDVLKQAMLDAHELGLQIAHDTGDEAYRRLQS